MPQIATDFSEFPLFPDTGFQSPGRNILGVPNAYSYDERGGVSFQGSDTQAYGNFIYTRDGEFATNQYCQVTTGDTNTFVQDGGSYSEDYTTIEVIINAPTYTPADATCVIGYFGINEYYTSYDEVLFVISGRNAVGGGVGGSAVYYPKELFFSTDEVPAGTRLRIERIGTDYYLYFYTPAIGEWQLVHTVNNIPTAPSGGYPGAQSYSKRREDSLLSRFVAGDNSDGFLTGNLGGPPGIHDDFARVSLGSDWESPSRHTAYGDEPLGIPALGSVGRGSPRTDAFIGSGIYTGNGEFSQMEQWVELEWNKDQRTGDQTNYTAYDEDFQYPYVGLHYRPQSENNYQGGRFSVGSWFYASYPSYTEMYSELRTRQSGGTYVQTGLDYVFVDPEVLLDEINQATGESVIPQGSKIRLEYVGGTYYGYFYSVAAKKWFLTSQVTPSVAPATPGYPLLAVNGRKDTPDPAPERFTNFAAGERGDGSTFLTELPGPHFDDFNRASIGSDYENPGQVTGAGVTGAMTIPSAGYIQAASITPADAGMTYIGQGEFWSKDQWAEAEFAEDVITGDATSTGYYANYGTMYLRLNMLPLADADKQGATMFFGPSYLPSSSPVHDLGMIATAKNAAGADSLTNFSQWTGNVSVLFGGDPSGDTGGFIPKGAKIRFERLDDVYSTYCWSPTKGAWFLLSRVPVNPANDMAENGSPGVGTITYTDTDNVRITNFSCGQRGDGSDFLGQYGFKQDAVDGFGFPVNDEWFMRRRKLRRRKEALLRAKKEEDDE